MISVDKSEFEGSVSGIAEMHKPIAVVFHLKSEEFDVEAFGRTEVGRADIGKQSIHVPSVFEVRPIRVRLLGAQS